MRKLLSLLLMTSFLVAPAVQPARADDWRDHGDIHHFHEHDYDHWRGGGWYHGFHDGRDGWWWIVDGAYYYYPSPVYPYPDPYTPPTVVVAPAPATTVVVPPSTVYYCSNPSGYYPYVPQCYAPWQKVASVPTVVAPVPQPQPNIVVAAESQRLADSRKLNDYAVAFQHTNLADPGARAKLKKLERKVEAFRKALYKRSYNAMDIVKDADNLEHRIAAQREALEHPAPPPTVMVAPPAVAPPVAVPPPGMPPNGMMLAPPSASPQGAVMTAPPMEQPPVPGQPH